MIGDILRSEREKLGLTVKDIERETSIRALYIEGIENSDYDSLPSEVYVRGFIKNYATFLKLNPELVMQQYREERPQKEELAGEDAGSTAQDSSDKMFRSGEDFKERVENSHRTQNIAIVIFVVIAAFVGSIYYFFGDDTTKKPQQVAVTEKTTKPQPAQKAPDKKDTSVKPADKKPDDKNAQQPVQNGQTDKKAAESKNGQPASQNTNQPAVGNVNVSAVFSERCWIQAVADGKTVFEGTVEKGQSFNWAAKERLFVTAGNAGAVEFSHNGKNLGKGGKIGEVIECTFTAKGVKKQ